MIENAGAIALAAVVGVGLFAAGCGGKMVSDAPTGSGGSTGGDGSSEAGVDSGPEFCPTTTCEQTPVPVSMTSAQQVYDVMAGRWLSCDGAVRLAAGPADAIGVEFERLSINARVGKMYYLVAGADRPVRGAGSAYTATYEVEAPSTIAPSFKFTVHPTQNSSSFWTLQSSRCPRKLYATDHPTSFVGIP